MFTDDPTVQAYLDIKKRLKAMHSELLTAVPQSQLTSCAKKLNLFKRGTLVLPHSGCADSFTDFLLYSWPSKEKSPVNTYVSPGNEDLLQGMRNNAMGLFAVNGIGPERLLCTEILRDEQPEEIIDIALAATLQPGSLLCMRRLKFPGFNMFTGAGFPVQPFQLGLSTALFRAAGKYADRCRFQDFKTMSDIQTVNLEALLITTGIKHCAHEYLSTQDV